MSRTEPAPKLIKQYAYRVAVRREIIQYVEATSEAEARARLDAGDLDDWHEADDGSRLLSIKREPNADLNPGQFTPRDRKQSY
ncbi:hypothetical protein CcrC1_gp058c [Caulobacter phage C1]|nr:hypothetical protein CcrC1_gp058c [Caulobacter phage C1]UTU08285.1 hypothetical protein CcrC2_gp057c [Caulobacter phage C2]UTU08808.1 hypothetical protein CcrJ4_gp057c [Caulobacter phage J4]UTU09360.1 hypothetical protein CcrBL47_gp074c [Caulobacter phage BL47]UTU09920.1 hypothetical protein CcrRB23_gp058c [Caulobacter phage RB23]WGN96945.1 hypothetical protein [Bertelyvirus sp.]